MHRGRSTDAQPEHQTTQNQRAYQRPRDKHTATASKDTDQVVAKIMDELMTVNGGVYEDAGKTLLQPCGHHTKYKHFGNHNHGQILQVLHTTKAKFQQFAARVRANPNLTPLKAQVGDKFHPPVSTILPKYINSARIVEDMRKARQDNSLPCNSNKHFDSITAFDLAHPNFLLPDSKTGIISISCFQTPFMCKCLSGVLHIDKQVIDFASAKCKEFILAFINIHLQNKQEMCSRVKLCLAAEHCLKGCQEHFQAAVVRYACKHSNINPEHAEAFKSMVVNLLKLDWVQDLCKAVAALYRRFPSCRLWLNWWLDNARAHMLFKAATAALGIWHRT
ncbi:hypothetical protein BDV98DRAFT_582276 [Pterulicium gracile]|uniref:Uncharacterized protein n=1 Tax=Pterulicium gracile TaxID=1884261 RepID=A0A5C3QJF3_9AGAR|nr:hypothetical protein BDV98DRAFT_582276 [Pterula gracilis]